MFVSATRGSGGFFANVTPTDERSVCSVPLGVVDLEEQFESAGMRRAVPAG